MLGTYNDMVDAGTVGADAYFHCRANCEASKRGAAGQDIACYISTKREEIQNEPLASRSKDEAANRQGQMAGLDPNADCYLACSSLIPPWGIPRRHLPPYANPHHIYSPKPSGTTNAP